MYKSVIYQQNKDEKTEQNLHMALAYMPYIYEDARSYKSAIDRGDYNKAVADAEQVGEKSLKAIAKKNGKLSNTMRSGHNGHNLEKLAAECGSEVQTSKEDLRFLSKGYFNSRYPEGKKKYSREEAEKCGITACGLLDIAIEELDVPNAELDKEFGINEVVQNIDDLGVYKRLMK